MQTVTAAGLDVHARSTEAAAINVVTGEVDGPAHPTRGTPYGASLPFATTTHLRLLSDPPSRKPPDAQRPRQQTAR